MQLLDATDIGKSCPLTRVQHTAFMVQVEFYALIASLCTAWQELDSAAGHEAAAELHQLTEPVATAAAAADADGAATEETWRSAWDALVALLHDKVSNAGPTY